ncbi:MAG: DUF2460 domain-containing protein [Rickettsiaceae bacterium]
MGFHNINLPHFIEVFAVGSSEFSTSCAVSMSGREIRSSDSVVPRRKYTLKGCRLSLAQFEAFNSFFIARAGKRFAFRLKDHFDFSVKKQIIASGSDGETKIQLHKIYPDELQPHARKITKPKGQTIKLWINQTELDLQEVDTCLGVITLPGPLGKGDVLVASFEFDVPVRFANDHFNYSFNTDGTISLDDVDMVEVIE